MINQNNYCIGIVPSNSYIERIIDFKSQLLNKHKIKFNNNNLPFVKLIEPFNWDETKEFLLVDSLKKYSSQSFSFELEFSSFEMISNDFLLKISEKDTISNFQRSLKYYLEIHNKIVFENYSHDNFEPKIVPYIDIDNTRKLNKIWTDLKGNSFNVHFTASKITLFAWNSNNWSIVKEFELE
jgi:hypothetical protein